MWAAFAAQSAWKSWVIAGLLAVVALLAFALARLAGRPPEVVLLGADGNATPVRRSLATEALLQFIGEHTRPAEVAVVRFTKQFLSLALSLNSSTVDSNWPEALARMAPELRRRVEAEALSRRLLETWRLAQRKTDILYEEVAVEDRGPGEVTVRATLTRRSGPLLGGAGKATSDRVEVELILRAFGPTLARPDGLEVVDWRLRPLASAAVAPTQRQGGSAGAQ